MDLPVLGADVLTGAGSLTEWDRDVLSAAVNDLTLQSPGRARAPRSNED